MKQVAKIVCLVLLTLLLLTEHATGQNLNKNINSFEVNRQSLGDVLEILSNKGNFYFSYNSSIIKKDSLVTLNAYNKSVRQILEFLFKSNYEFRESSNYIIIRRAPIRLTLITNKAVSDDKFYAVTGYVLDDASGEVVSEASIYEKQRLVSTLTNQQGYFKIKLKSKFKTAALSVSKEFYEDTTVAIQPNRNQQITITIVPVESTGTTVTISPEDYLTPDSITVEVGNDSAFTSYTYRKVDSVKVEKTRAGKFLLSARQKVQSINLQKFFIARPYQLSFTPGLSTNGKMNAQVINKASINILGGYSGGINGVEFGGLFNINKKNMQYFQAGGLFNLVGGKMEGVQFAGLHNTVLDSITGIQAAGISNYVKGKVRATQLAGIYNHAADTVSGAQIAGVANYARKKTTGAQVAGVANFSNIEMKGVQIAGVFNYAKRLKGMQIGLINVTDSSEGISLGLINIVRRNGYHKLSVSANEVMNTNLDIKTGNSKLYTLLKAGIHLTDSGRIYSFGAGLAHDFLLSKRFSISTELSSQYLYLGSFDYTNLLNKLQLNLNFHLNKYISVFAGPAWNVYYSDQEEIINGYKKLIPNDHYKKFNMGKDLKAWFGWNAGITIF